MPGKREPPPSPRHDASYKSFFARRRTVADTLRAFAGDLARHLDFATLEQMPASFATRALDQRHADMLWRVRTDRGRWLYILILLEFQSTVDRRMALRMMEYTVSIWKRLAADDLGPRGEYPFVLPIVVYNGERRWTAPTDVCDLLAPVPKELLGYRPRHRYLLIEIQAEDPAALPPDNVLAMIARFEQAPTATVLEELVGSLPDWFSRIGVPEFEELFMAWVTHVVTQRHGERGRAEGERALARRLARDRFGPGAARELSHVLDDLPEAAEVPHIVKLIFECETAEEFLERVREA